ASTRRSSVRSLRARWRSTATPVLSPAATTGSAGSTRHGAPSSSTAMRSRPTFFSAVTRGALAISSSTSVRDAGLRPGPLPFRVGLLDRRHLRGGPLGLWQEARRDDLLVRCLRLDPGEDRLDDVRVLRQERRRVLPTLTEPLVAEAEVRAGLLDDLLLQRDVD